MSGKILGPENLRRTLKRIHTFGPWREADAIADHIAALEADNAAKASAIDDALDHMNAVVAALHESENEREREVRDHLLKAMRRDAGSALLEEHRRALVRARNEGREEAAQEVGTVATKPHKDSEARMLLDYAMDRIRAMKES